MAQLTDAFGFYAILTSPVRGYDYLTRLLVDNQVAFIQLRKKEVPEAEVRGTAELMRRLTAGTPSRFIVNDFPRLAADVGADGVHIGQGDTAIEEARKIVGPDAIVGLSTHSPEQTRNACSRGPDYIGIGPVWPTTTKRVADPAIGIAGMRKMLAIATVPAVVLGSITTENLPEVLAAGARNFSLVRPLNGSTDPDRVLKEILRVYGSFEADSP